MAPVTGNCTAKPDCAIGPDAGTPDNPALLGRPACAVEASLPGTDEIDTPWFRDGSETCTCISGAGPASDSGTSKKLGKLVTLLFPAALVLGVMVVAVLPVNAPLFASALAMVGTAVGAGGEYFAAQTSAKLTAARGAEALPPTAPAAVPLFVANANSRQTLTISVAGACAHQDHCICRANANPAQQNE